MSFYGPRKYSECKFKKYDKVEVVKGRKVPLGTVGEVFWISDVQFYGQSRFANYNYRVGVRDASGKVHWTYDSNLKLLERDGRPASLEWIATNYGSYYGVVYAPLHVEANEEAVELEDSIYEDGANQ